MRFAHLFAFCCILGFCNLSLRPLFRILGVHVFAFFCILVVLQSARPVWGDASTKFTQRLCLLILSSGRAPEWSPTPPRKKIKLRAGPGGPDGGPGRPPGPPRHPKNHKKIRDFGPLGRFRGVTWTPFNRLSYSYKFYSFKKL